MVHPDESKMYRLEEEKWELMGHMRRVAFFAVALSTVAVLACVVGLPLANTYIQRVQSSMFIEMDYCRARNRDLWSEIFNVHLAKGETGGAIRVARRAETRAKRTATAAERKLWRFGGNNFNFAAQSTSNENYGANSGQQGQQENYGSEPAPDPSYGGNGGYGEVVRPVQPSKCCTCQIGGPGPAGRPGSRGRDGGNGKNGKRGKDGSASVGPRRREHNSRGGDTCPPLPCPAGRPGPRGSPGSKGRKGPKGPNGNGGGRGGRPGPAGRPGPRGRKGGNGRAGPKGPRGDPGRRNGRGRAPPGRPGPAGRPGRQGRPGNPGSGGNGGGRPGARGPPGDKGDPGRNGRPGIPGKKGDDGIRGGGGSCDHCPPPRTAPGY